MRGRGGGQMVSVAFYSDDPSSNLAESTVLILSSFFKGTKINEKGAGDGPSFKKNVSDC